MTAVAEITTDMATRMEAPVAMGVATTDMGQRIEMARPSFQRSIAAALGLLLLGSCTTSPPRPAGVSPKLEAACKANHPTHGWKLAEPPEPARRRLFTVPRDAKVQLWFRGRDNAIAVCTPCTTDANAVRSFEWYAAGFKDGELAHKNCSAKPR
jgi:hypothetical protein